LARKYRPKTLEELRGQTQAVKLLQESLKNDRIAPAYLFSGPRGVGKTSAARIFAKAAACTDLKRAPCEKCDSCMAIQSGQAMHLLEIDGASHTGVDDVRRLIEAAQYRPTLGRKNVYIVDEVHMLSQAAFNALLKTLEEPPNHVLFILATTELQKIPDTILSRVQRVELRRIPEPEILSSLRDIVKSEGVSASEEVLSQIASAADGAFRDAQTLLEQVLLLSGGTEAQPEIADQLLGSIGISQEIRILELLAESNAEGFLNLIQNYFSRGKDLERIHQRLVFWIRCLLLQRSAPELQSLKEEAPAEALAKLAQAFSLWSDVDLDRLFDVLWSGYERMKRTDLPHITLETTLIKASRLPKTRDLSKLIAALEAKKSSEVMAPSAPAVQVGSHRTLPPPPPPPPAFLPDRAPSKEQTPASERPTNIEQLLQAIRKTKASIFPLISSAQSSEWKNNTLSLGFPAGHFALDQLSDPTMKKELLQVLHQIVGKEQMLQLSESEKPIKTAAPQERVDFMKEAKQKALHDPKVLKAAELLQGKVTGVTIEGVKSS
jgi:DNA polymerase III subunit gamma/tau